MDIKISTEFIKLQQLLKLANILDSGSDIKYYLEQSIVSVNGETATQRGKKIYPGDVVEVEGFEQIIVC
ncbi:MAG: S4 domain-containing protein YaaA [Lachnospirales bacterium]